MTKTIHGKTYNGHDIACVLQDAGKGKIVIFCHDLCSTSTGENRFFVRAAQALAAQGISSLRFDQFGSGNSDGDFFQSGFYDWVKTICAIADDYRSHGHAVALLGQGVGAAAAIAAAAEKPFISAVVACAPRLQLEDFPAPPESRVAEKGQQVQARFWQEAYTARVAEKLAALKAPVYIMQCMADEYADEKSRKAIAEKAAPHHVVESWEGYAQSGWTAEQVQQVIGKGAAFLAQHFPEQVQVSQATVQQPAQQRPVRRQPRPQEGAQEATPAMGSDDVQRKIQQILDEERRKQKPKKPPFDYKKHMNMTIVTGGLWLPVWIAMSLHHDYKWRKAQRDKKQWQEDERRG